MSRPAVVLLAYAVLAAIVVPVFPHFVSPNETTRWLLAASLVEERTVDVTDLAPILGPRMEDLAEVNGRLYSNKAPGAAFAGLPGYLAAKAFTGEPSPSSLRASMTAMRLVASTLPLLVMGWGLIRFARARNVPEERVAFALAVLLFGTPLFAYGLLLFSHALVAAALFGAWLLLEERRDFTAGALLGIAVLSEYTAAVPAAILLLSAARQWRRVLRIVLGGLPFALALALYHQAAYGSVFGLPYGHDTLPQFREVAGRGIAGVSWPSLKTLGLLLFHPGKGLLVFSPVLALSLMGRRHWTLAAVPASIVLVYAGYANWHGGWSVGPRYILPAVPFLVVPLMLRQSSRLEGVLFGWSFAAVVMTSLVFPFVPNAFPFPWMSLAAPLAGSGLVAPNLFHVIAPPLAVAVPALIAAGATTVALRKAAVYAFGGALIAVIAGAQFPRLADENRLDLERSYIAEVYFERRGTLVNAPPGLLRRRELELTLPPQSWPF